MSAGRKRAAVLLVVGLSAMVGDVTGLAPLMGLGLATHAAPMPKVFTARDGLEGFSADYTLRWVEADGPHELVLGPEVYAGVQGPYNRRNVYGAALAGGPFLSEHQQLGELHQAVSTYAFCEGDLLGELGVPAAPIGPVQLVVEPTDGTDTHLPLLLEVSC